MQTASTHIKAGKCLKGFDLDLSANTENRRLLKQRSKGGRLWLRMIIVLDLALSPWGGAAWSLLDYLLQQQESRAELSGALAVTRGSSGLDLKDAAHALHHFDMEKMIDQLAGCALLHDLTHRLERKCNSITSGDYDVCPEGSCVGAPDSQILGQLGDESASSVARHLTRLSFDFGALRKKAHISRTIESSLGLMTESCYLPGASWLASEEPSLLNLQTPQVRLMRVNQDELAQPELCAQSGEEGHPESLLIVSQMVVGHAALPSDFYEANGAFRARRSLPLHKRAQQHRGAFQVLPLGEASGARSWPAARAQQ